MKGWFLPAILIGLVLLGMGAVWTASGHRDDVSVPSIKNDGPSGLSALARLLEKRGWQVAFDRNRRPKLGPKDIAVAVHYSADLPVWDSATKLKTPGDQTLQKFVVEGGRMVSIPLVELFNTQKTSELTVTNWYGDERTVLVGTEDSWLNQFDLGVSRDDEPDESTTEERKVPLIESTSELWGEEETMLVAVVLFGKGEFVRFDQGLLATNRYLAEKDNATVVVNSMEALAHEGDRFVFVEATFGGADQKSMLGFIGGWAEAGFRQALVVFALIVFTLGKRFGLPETTRRVQRGTRDLVDAVASIMERGRRGRQALKLTVQRTDHEVRRALKLPKDAPANKRNELLPEGFAATLARAEDALHWRDLDETVAVRLAQQLDRGLAEFLRR